MASIAKVKFQHLLYSVNHPFCLNANAILSLIPYEVGNCDESKWTYCEASLLFVDDDDVVKFVV